MRQVSKPDYIVENHGTIFLFRPLNTAAREHLEQNTEDTAQWFGGALVVEHRYAESLAYGLQENGFTVAG